MLNKLQKTHTPNRPVEPLMERDNGNFKEPYIFIELTLSEKELTVLVCSTRVSALSQTHLVIYIYIVHGWSVLTMYSNQMHLNYPVVLISVPLEKVCSQQGKLSYLMRITWEF